MPTVKITLPCAGCCGGKCDDVATYELTLASDVVCTVCISSAISGASSGGSMSWNTRTISGVFTLNGGLSDPSLGVWTFSLSGAADVLFTWFPTSGDCSGDPVTDQSSEPLMQFICSDGKLSFRIFSVANSAETGQWHYFFLNNNVTLGVPFSNELAGCGTATVGLDLFFPARKVITAGTGGTGMIS